MVNVGQMRKPGLEWLMDGNVNSDAGRHEAAGLAVCINFAMLSVPVKSFRQTELIDGPSK